MTRQEILSLVRKGEKGYFSLPFSENLIKDLDITLRGDRSTFSLIPSPYKALFRNISKVIPADDSDELVSGLEEKLGTPPFCMNIILDIDGTLVEDVNDPDVLPRPRPFLKEFFTYIFQTFCHVSIWTASGKERADRMTNELFVPVLNEINPSYRFDFIWTGNKVAVSRKWRLGGDYTSTVVKDLKKVYKAYKYYTKDNTVILDDTSTTYRRNYGNAIGILTWRGDRNDRELVKVVENIKEWKKQADTEKTVRHVRKFSWPI